MQRTTRAALDNEVVQPRQGCNASSIMKELSLMVAFGVVDNRSQSHLIGLWSSLRMWQMKG
jgi:hypothetical protein